ncbi:MAG: SDR family NAD(P)-dependent oxidoreductase [Alphaproteobacteria bacterium]|nr:SDR family NAD(P)-dependent oxidoreductase [Alphaproteobacteria bacterium]
MITGSSGQLGSALASALIKEGASLILVARTIPQLEALEDSLTPYRTNAQSLTLVPINLEEQRNFSQFALNIGQRFGRLDALISCAATMSGLTPLTEWHEESWRRIMSVNFEANWLLLKAFHPLLLKSKAGRAVFLSDAVIEESAAYWGPYGLSKIALEKMVQLYVEENKGTSVRANVLRATDFPSSLKSTAYPKRDTHGLLSLDALVESIVPLISEDCRVSGQVINVGPIGIHLKSPGNSF